MNTPLILWQLGDRWADLRTLVQKSITVVTTNGTATMLDVADGWSCRVPLHGGHRMAGDLARRPLAEVVVATSCGLVTRGDTLGSDHSTTRVSLVIDGLHEDWQDHVRWPLSEVWNPAGHPECSCGAAYCIVDKLIRAAG